MARVGERFFFFCILLVGSTLYLPHPVSLNFFGLAFLALVAVAMIFLLHFFPWDRYEPRVFTSLYTLSSSFLIALLVYLTGGMSSSYKVLFFLIILFSYFYNLAEMLLITSVVTFFFLLPWLYQKPELQHYTATAVLTMFFYLGTYILYGVTRFILKRNIVLEDLNKKLLKLYSFASDLLNDIEKESLIDSLSESLKDHLPTTYMVLLLLDDKKNLTTRIACPIRMLSWEPAIGALYPSDKLRQLRSVLETGKPEIYRLESDVLDADSRKIITKETRSLLVVPLGVAAENEGLLVFGEERRWERSPITEEKIQLSQAISRQVAIVLNLRRCYERMNQARHDLHVSHDRIIKAERLAALGEVTRTVEHEINNPLSVIVNWAEIYREDESISPDLRNKFIILYDMAMRISDVIRKLTELKETKTVEYMKGQRMTDIT